MDFLRVLLFAKRIMAVSSQCMFMYVSICLSAFCDSFYSETMEVKVIKFVG